MASATKTQSRKSEVGSRSLRNGGEIHGDPGEWGDVFAAREAAAAEQISPAALQPHPLALAVDRANDEDRKLMRDSIAEKYDARLGPILIYRGKVLDGWTRVELLAELGTPINAQQALAGAHPWCEVLPEMAEVEAEELVQKLNIARRHLDYGRKALRVAEALGYGVSRETPPTGPRPTKRAAAKAAGLSVTTLHRATEVASEAVPEVIDAVKRGMPLYEAHRLRKLPADEQRAAAAKTPAERKADRAAKPKPAAELALPNRVLSALDVIRARFEHYRSYGDLELLGVAAVVWKAEIEAEQRDVAEPRKKAPVRRKAKKARKK